MDLWLTTYAMSSVLKPSILKFWTEEYLQLSLPFRTKWGTRCTWNGGWRRRRSTSWRRRTSSEKETGSSLLPRLFASLRPRRWRTTECLGQLLKPGLRPTSYPTVRRRLCGSFGTSWTTTVPSTFVSEKTMLWWEMLGFPFGYFVFTL